MNMNIKDRIAFQRIGLVLGMMILAKNEPNPRKALRELIRNERLSVRRTLKSVRLYLKSGNIGDLWDDGSGCRLVWTTRHGFGDAFKNL